MNMFLFAAVNVIFVLYASVTPPPDLSHRCAFTFLFSCPYHSAFTPTGQYGWPVGNDTHTHTHSEGEQIFFSPRGILFSFMKAK